ncbi:TetR/AcrR family transcriptional regulator [Mycobacteroides chelonae]|jgi:AcrR family transcriptional regulator
MYATQPATRRTHAERREATRLALLDAAVACLIEDGYTALTTRKVAERAGVSQGAQQHYFRGRAELIVEAVGHLATRLATQARDKVRDHTNEGDRFAALLDHVWAIHTGPAFQAATELWSAARTDADLRGPVEDLGRALDRQLGQIASEMLPTLLGDDTGRTLLDLSLASARGLAMRRLPGLETTVDRRWQATRAFLLTDYQIHIDDRTTR